MDATFADNKAVVSRFYETISKDDIAGLAEILHADYRMFLLSTREWLSKDDFLNIERTAAAGGQRLFREALQFELLSTVCEDDRVAVRVHGYGVMQDGAIYDQLYHNLHTIRDGMVSETMEFNDTKLVHDLLRRGPGGAIGVPAN